MINKLCILLFFFILFGCKQQTTCVRQKMNIDYFIDLYYIKNYEYPLSLDELLFFCESNLCDMQSIQDSVLIEYTCLKNNSKKISWIVDETGFPKQELFVLFEKDTLTYRMNEWRFPCIGFYNDAFVNCYLKEPESLEDFLSFCYYCDSLDDGTNMPYDKCNGVTLKNLKKCQQIESFQWINNADELLLLIGRDTIWHHNNESLPCNESLKPLFQPHYYDKMGRYVQLKENIDCVFKKNMRKLWYQHYHQSPQKVCDYHTLVFCNTGFFYSFCENDSLDTNTRYFRDLGLYLKDFSKENGLSKIIFCSPVF